jgi:hypothetical protein
MAIFRLQITSIARGGGQSSVGAAAYRAGERLRDDRANELHNHSRRKDALAEQGIDREPGHTSAPASELPRSAPAAPKSLEDIRREARENWLKMRAAQTSKPADPAHPSRDAQTGHGPAPATHSTGAQSLGADGRPDVTTPRTHNSPAPDDDYQP